jgi:uncharacterized protein
MSTLINEQVFEKIRKEAKARYMADEQKMHGNKTNYAWAHVERVYNLCVKIGRAENTDLDVLKAAALLHDIGKFRASPSEHGVRAQIAKRVLRKAGFPKEKIEAVIHAIEGHAPLRKTRKTREAEILLDADILEKFGAVGVATVFLRCALSGDKIENSIKKHREWFERMKSYVKSETAKKIFEERYRFTKHFFERFEREAKAEL